MRRWLLGFVGGAGMAGAGVLVATGCDRSAAGAPSRPLEVRATIGEVGLSPGQFVYPRALDADAGSLWVIDKAARVQRIDPQTGRVLAGWRMPEFATGKPVGVTIAPGSVGGGAGGGGGPLEELLYIPDTHYFRVMMYRPPSLSEDAGPGAEGEAALVGQFGSYGHGPGQFIYLTDVAVLTEGSGAAEKVHRIYVSEYGGNDRISVFDGSYAFLFSFGQFGTSDSPDQIEFNRPQSLAIDPIARELIVADACNHRIGRFTLDGQLVRWIGSPEAAGDGPGQLLYPYGLHLRGDGTALVAEYGNNRVQHLDLATGESLGLFGTTGRGAGELAAPWAVTVIGDMAYVLDSGNNRILGFPAPTLRSRKGISR